MTNLAPVMENGANTVHTELLDAVLESAIDGIIIIDEQGIVLRFNNAAAGLFGYDKDEVVGRNIKMIMPEPDHSAHDGYLKDYLKTGKAAIIGVGREVHGRKQDGSTFPLRLAVSEVIVEDTRYFAGVLHDLTDIKAREREILGLTEQLERKVQERTDDLEAAINKLLQINKRLEHEVQERKTAEVALRRSQKDLRESLEKEKELSDLKSRFVSTASHEFRTPLSTILSSASLVGKYLDAEHQPQREKHIERIKTAVKTLTTILDDFLSLSKLEHGEIVVKLEEIQVSEFLEKVLEEMEGMVRSGQCITIRDASEGLRFQTDPVVLRNILYNLLSNAIKYGGEEEIVCAAYLDGKTLCIDVIDHGIGIPYAEQKHLFERFFRAYNATNIQGTGLGLYIVSNYLRLLGGRIEFQSEEGQGSTFTIIIPIK